MAELAIPLLGLAGAYIMSNQKKKDDQPKKKPVPPPPRVGRKKKNKGIDAAAKLPTGNIIFIIHSYPHHQMQTQTTQTVAYQGLFVNGTGNH